ncbi:MAG: M20/M25/M40 family metallo-hydrolase [Calditrichaeota bacterium]|nr:MAG: M20/M25/M40 family metallo-hydrolase [Calditrichota bacterium]
MTRFRCLFIALIGICLYSALLTAQPNPVYLKTSKEIVKSALQERRGYQLLGELCQLGPRLSGSPTSLKAIDWAKSTMERMGLDRIILQPVKVPRWVRGEVEAATIVSSTRVNWRPLRVAALGGSVGTPPEGITAPVIEVQNFEELKSLGERVKGKIVFFNRPFPRDVVTTFRGYGMTVDQRVHGASEAARLGAVAVLVRSVTTSEDNVPHVGGMRYAKDVPKIPAAAIGIQDADYLSELLKEDPELTVNIQLGCENQGEVWSYNVIGDLLGSEYPEEYVVVAGHFDSWDKGQGAHDDGGGCLQALEVLDIFKRLNIKPRRTIRCIFYINEENGIRGALAYAKMADSLGLKHVAAIESDRGCFTPRGFSVTADSVVIERIAGWLPYLRQAGIEWVRPGGSGVDVAQIKKITALIGYVPDSQRYFDFHHSEKDVYEAVNPREFELGAAAMSILTYLISEEGLANSPTHSTH